MPSDADSGRGQGKDTDEFYIHVMQLTIDAFTTIFGEKTALMHARKAPLTITPDGTVIDYYGEGEQAFEVLLTQYEDVFGPEAADRKVRNALYGIVSEEEKDRLPERVQPRTEREKVYLRDQLRRLLPALSGVY